MKIRVVNIEGTNLTGIWDLERITIKFEYDTQMHINKSNGIVSDNWPIGHRKTGQWNLS